MTDKQKMFCTEYLKDYNAYQAALRAGYKETTAQQSSQWIDKSQKKSNKKYNPEMRAFIDYELNKMNKSNIATAEEIREFLSSCMRGEHKEEVLKFSGDGRQTVVKVAVSERDRLKAAELMGKGLGMFKEKVDLTGAVPVAIVNDVEE